MVPDDLLEKALKIHTRDSSSRDVLRHAILPGHDQSKVPAHLQDRVDELRNAEFTRLPVVRDSPESLLRRAEEGGEEARKLRLWKLWTQQCRHVAYQYRILYSNEIGKELETRSRGWVFQQYMG